MKYKAPFKKFCTKADALLVNILDANGERYAQNIPIGDARMLIEFLNEKYADPISEIVKRRKLQIKHNHENWLVFDQDKTFDISIVLEDFNVFRDELFAKYVCDAINEKLERDGYISPE